MPFAYSILFQAYCLLGNIDVHEWFYILVLLKPIRCGRTTSRDDHVFLECSQEVSIDRYVKDTWITVCLEVGLEED